MIEEARKEREEWQRASEEAQRKIEIQLEENQRKEEEEQRKREIQKKEFPQKLREMTEYYIHSDLLHAILLELCQGDLSNRPIEIEVCRYKITARMSCVKKEFAYYFCDHRVLDLKDVSDATIEASPVIAFAHAINHLLGDDYICDDSPIISRLELKRINTF